ICVRNAFASVIRDRALGAVVVVQQQAVRAMLGKRQVPRILRVVAKVPLVVIHRASPRLQEPANANPGASGCPPAMTPALGVRVKIIRCPNQAAATGDAACSRRRTSRPPGTGVISMANLWCLAYQRAFARAVPSSGIVTSPPAAVSSVTADEPSVGD